LNILCNEATEILGWVFLYPTRFGASDGLQIATTPLRATQWKI